MASIPTRLITDDAVKKAVNAFNTSITAEETAQDLLEAMVTTATTDVGTVGAAPASGTIALSSARVGPIITSTITLTAARLTVADGAGSGAAVTDVLDLTGRFLVERVRVQLLQTEVLTTELPLPQQLILTGLVLLLQLMPTARLM